MSSVEEKMIHLINEQPDDSSFDEIVRELMFARMIESGNRDFDEGRVLSDEEMKKRILAW